MELHTCLWNEVDAFDFGDDDLAPLKLQFPNLHIQTHQCVEDFLATAQQVDFLLTWDFEFSWYQACSRLKAIFTPAAGDDWVQSDPNEKVKLVPNVTAVVSPRKLQKKRVMLEMKTEQQLKKKPHLK